MDGETPTHQPAGEFNSWLRCLLYLCLIVKPANHTVRWNLSSERRWLVQESDRGRKYVAITEESKGEKTNKWKWAVSGGGFGGWVSFKAWASHSRSLLPGRVAVRRTLKNTKISTLASAFMPADLSVLANVWPIWPAKKQREDAFIAQIPYFCISPLWVEAMLVLANVSSLPAITASQESAFT